MRGHMAKCYGDLIQELWSGAQKSIAPLKLRVHLWTNILITNLKDFEILKLQMLGFIYYSDLIWSLPNSEDELFIG